MRAQAYVLFTAAVLNFALPGGGAADPVLSSAPGRYYEAAVRGDPEAQFELARIYATGEGAAQSDASALQWCWRAAEQGNASAQLMLSRFFAEGRAVHQDRVMAFEWASLARMNTRSSDTATSASRMIERLAQELTTAEIHEALTRVDRWRPSAAPRQTAEPPKVPPAVRVASVDPADGAASEGKPEVTSKPATAPGVSGKLRHPRRPPAAADAEDASPGRMKSRRGGWLLRLARRLWER